MRAAGGWSGRFDPRYPAFRRCYSHCRGRDRKPFHTSQLPDAIRILGDGNLAPVCLAVRSVSLPGGLVSFQFVFANRALDDTVDCVHTECVTLAVCCTGAGPGCALRKSWPSTVDGRTVVGYPEHGNGTDWLGSAEAGAETMICSVYNKRDRT